MCYDLCFFPSDRKRIQRASLFLLYNIQILHTDQSICLCLKHTLYLLDIAFHILKILGKEHTSSVQKTDMIADILQLTQIMGCDHAGQPPLFHLACDHTFYTLAHDRIQPVKGFITDQIFGMRTNRQ